MNSELALAEERFSNAVRKAELIVSNVETLWITAPNRSDVRRQIGRKELNALYGMAFLSIFGSWEGLVEEVLVRMVAGKSTSTYTPTSQGARLTKKTLTNARLQVLNGRRYLLWHDATRSADRVARHVDGSPLEQVLRANIPELDRFAAIRHAIAHNSADARTSFDVAAIALVGTNMQSPGELLRTQDFSDPLNPVRWIRKISGSLRAMAQQATA